MVLWRPWWLVMVGFRESDPGRPRQNVLAAGVWLTGSRANGTLFRPILLEKENIPEYSKCSRTHVEAVYNIVPNHLRHLDPKHTSAVG
jgi:hypothetical protein